MAKVSIASRLKTLPLLEGEFSARSRQKDWKSLSEEVFDIVIIGGGIVGAGIAYEATGRGLKVALVEKGDFASGTSSKSSKLLHGGVRYLEQYHFGLVFEALAGRNRLFDKFPHLIKKVPFFVPIYNRYPERPWLINIGLWLYYLFSWLSSPFHTLIHRFVDKKQLPEIEPEMERNDFQGGLEYYDASTDDARLVLETIKTAQASGAKAFNHTAVIGFEKNASNRVESVIVEDQITGTSTTIKAHKVVNATGPWADTINLMADPDYKPRLRPTKGIHIIIPKVTYEDRAIVLKSVPDDSDRERWMFIIPYDDYSIVGTTDTDHEECAEGDYSYLDDDNYASKDDVDYLLASVNRLYPEAKLTAADVISSYGGWRPLVAPEKAVHESDISRKHEIFETKAGIVVMAGGKLTTYMIMAQELVDHLAKHYPEVIKPQSENTLEPLCNRWETGDMSLYFEYVKESYSKYPVEMLSYLVERYGTEASHILYLYQNYFPDYLKSIENLSNEIPLRQIEVIYSVLFEMTVTLKDFMLNRHRVILRDRHQGLEAAPEIVELMAEMTAELQGWTDEERELWKEQQLQEFRDEVTKTNAWREQL